MFAFISLLHLNVCQAQSAIDYTQVGLMKADYDHRAVLYFRNSQKAAVAIFGPPSSRSTYYSEMDNINLDVLNYGNNKLYFDSEGLVMYEILSPAIAVGKNYATSFRVGNNRGVNAVFHGLSVDPIPHNTVNMSYNACAVAAIKSGDTVLDYGVTVLFDANGNAFSISLDATN